MKDLIVTPPEGYEVDKENSTFEKIVFKKIKEESKRWRDDESQRLYGCYIDDYCSIRTTDTYNTSRNFNVFVTKKQAMSALAMARISQIMENDKRFGGVVTDEEWGDKNIGKYVILRVGNKIQFDYVWTAYYHFLAFHTKEQRDLFLEENEDLIKSYFMLD